MFTYSKQWDSCRGKGHCRRERGSGIAAGERGSTGGKGAVG